VIHFTVHTKFRPISKPVSYTICLSKPFTIKWFCHFKGMPSWIRWKLDILICFQDNKWFVFWVRQHWTSRRTFTYSIFRV